jgi:hypothetical protein
MTYLEAQQALCRKLDISYSDIASNDLFSLDDIKEWLQLGSTEAWDYKPWPFSDDVYTITATAPDLTAGYIDHPEELAFGSVHTLLIDGEEFTGPIRFSEYLKYKKTNPNGTDKIWAYHRDLIFINSNAYSAGAVIDLLGKQLAPVLSADNDLLPFSPTSDNKEYAGNKSIVDLAHAYALESERLKRAPEGELIRKKAYQVLNLIWEPFSSYVSTKQNFDRPMFNIPDFFGQGNTARSENTFNQS